ncbi:MAG: conjugal transfer protein TrbI [Burkholderiaceae bacterium]|jgi:type IV secretion system protein VirB10|nr:conjugal transfer protein TrbI [Burkholderiaceae bacterium]
MAEFTGFEDKKVEDVTGVGAGKAIPLQQPHQRLGVRLSKRSKVIVVGGFAVMLLMIFYGIMTAGQRNAQVGALTDDSPGQQHPDFSGMRNTAPPAIPVQAAASKPLDENDCEKRNNSPWPCAPKSKASAPPSAAQKHKDWLTNQYYKDLEEDVMARRAATQSEVKSQNMQVANGPARRQPEEGLPGETARENIGRTLLAANNPGISGGNLQADYLRALGGNNAGKAGIDANKAWQQDVGQNKSAGGYLPATRQAPRGDYELFAGSIIPAVMVTAIDSDLPGTITAQVRRTVYDSRDPSIVLVPQSAKLVGEYNSMVQYGQERLMVIWNEIIYPDGSTLDLKGMSGTDLIGQAGFSDEVNNHYMKIFGSAALISLFGAAAQMSQPQNSNMWSAPTMQSQATANFANTFNSAALNILNKNLNIAPTLNIRPGYPFNVLVNKTIVMEPWAKN